MSELTTSEIMFEQFCASHDIVYTRVPTASSRTPDYQITLGIKMIVVEIKQIDPNHAEQREMKEFQEKGWTVSGKGAPGNRMRKVIAKANGQLKSKCQGKFPSLVVVYENVPHTLHTAPYCILVAMYGLEQHNLSVPHDWNRSVRLIGKSFGGERMMTPIKNTSTSAVAVLKGHDPSDYMLEVYHNIFAVVPLDPTLLAGFPIRQFTLPRPDEPQFQNWMEIGKSTEYTIDS